MNLKEAFRYQNKLQWLMTEAEEILRRDRNVVKVEQTALLHKVNPDAVDETTIEPADTVYADQITDIAVLLMFLLGERERLSRAIREAKKAMDMDFDGEVSLNTRRQELASIFRNMVQLRSSETVISGGGVGYKFNAEGNQVRERIDLDTKAFFKRSPILLRTRHLAVKGIQKAAKQKEKHTPIRVTAPREGNHDPRPGGRERKIGQNNCIIINADHKDVLLFLSKR
jgi:hypothetical protein